MSAGLRHVDSGLDDPRRNVGISAALAELHAAGAVPDTIRLHSYTPSVLLGRGAPLSAVDLEFCSSNAIGLARRVTGGGAVFMSPAMLAWEIVLARRDAGGDLASAMRRACGGIAGSLSEMGVDAHFAEPGSITVRGRKIAGASGYQESGSVLVQGSLLLVDETTMMAGALRMELERLAPSLTCLGAAMSCVPDVRQVSSALARGLAHGFERHLVPGALGAGEIALAARLHDAIYGREDFVMHGDAAI